MRSIADVFKVYQTGKLTVVAFAGQDYPSFDRVEQCRNELAKLLTQHHCEDVAFDLTGVPFIPSGVLGLLVSLRQLGVKVHVYNPSEQVQDVLQVTKLNQKIQIQFVDDVQKLLDDLKA